jgi:hypothetical protein
MSGRDSLASMMVGHFLDTHFYKGLEQTCLFTPFVDSLENTLVRPGGFEPPTNGCKEMLSRDLVCAMVAARIIEV